ncbi:MAG: glycosyl hydrolase, partial [Candidatus Bathyarchaeia archaeon]
LYIDEDTGCADIAIDPQETNIVYASTWQFRRKGWFFTSGGVGSGLHKSTDGGKTWRRLTRDMPEGELGRIAIAVAPTRPNVVYANIESKKTALYRSDDMGESWKRVNSSLNITVRPFYFSFLMVDHKDYNKVYKLGLGLGVSRDGGQSFSDVGGSTHSDHHALWVDAQNSSFMYLGTDGGVYKTYDGGNSWSMLRNLPVSQFYHVSADMSRPYNVYGGLQDNGSWTGPSQSPGGIQNSDWKNTGFGDGFYCFADPSDPNVIYSEYQGGRLLRYHRSTGETKFIAPFPKDGEPKLRFNWNTPFQMSRSNPKAIYLGSQFLFVSTDQGESWTRISGDLTTNDPEKQRQEESGGLSIDNSTAENHCTIYTISDSPLDSQVIWTGSDDGQVQLTRDGGKSWQNLTANIPVPVNSWVSSIEASHHEAATAYATFDRHTFGDMRPYIYRTTDYGKTWQSIATDDIKGFAHIVREDPVNPKLLFVGTEHGLYISVDGGRQWGQFTGKFPQMVPVRDLVIHPREHDLIIATHGRGIYIVDDITPLRQLTEEILAKPLHIFKSRPSPTSIATFEQDFPGSDEFVGSSLPEVAYITYYLKDRHIVGDFKIEILDAEGKLITTLPGSKRRGINRVSWFMRMKAP